MASLKGKKKLTDLLVEALNREILDEQLIEKLLSEGADINLPNNMGWTYLQYACIHNNIRLVKRIIKIGVNINYADISGWTALHEASANGHLEIVKLLLAANANPNQCLDAKEDKRTPFDLASEKGHVDTVLYLQNFCNEKYPDRWPPLHIAAYSNNLEGVKKYLNTMVIDELNHYNWTPLCLAAKQGHTKIVTFLINQGANLTKGNLKERTPLHITAFHNQTEVMKIILNTGFNINQPDKDARTPLFSACVGDLCFDAVKLLVENNATINYQDKKGKTALHAIAENGNPESTTILQLLIDSGADPNIQDKNGNTPLLLCKYLGRPFNMDIAMVLIKNGADIHKKNNEGISSLQLYTSQGSSKSKELVTFMHTKHD